MSSELFSYMCCLFWFQSCMQRWRPWGALQAGWRGISNKPVQDVSSNQPPETGSFPPLQSYSEEENMMREAGELWTSQYGFLLAFFCSDWNASKIRTPAFLTWQWKNMHKSGLLPMYRRWMKTLPWTRKSFSLYLNRGYVNHLISGYKLSWYNISLGFCI